MDKIWINLAGAKYGKALWTRILDFNSIEIFRFVHKFFGASKDTNSGDTNELSEGTLDPPNVAIISLYFLGEGGIGTNIEFFTDLAYKKAEPKDNMKV